MEPLCSISVWASSLSAHSRAACGWALWGLRARGCPLFSGGSSVSSGPSGLGLQGHGAASRLRGAGLPQCPPAGRHCKRENEDEVDISCVQLSADWRSISEYSGVGSGGESSMCKWRVFSSISFRWPRGWPSRMFFRVGGQFSCPCFFRRLSFPLGSFVVWFSWTYHVHMCSFLGSLFSPGVPVSVFLPVPHCGGYYRAVL